jgi:tetratricopeptide (TPR) repeat protein
LEVQADLVQSLGSMPYQRITFAVLLALASAVSAQAAGGGARERCLGDNDVDVDMRISACSTVIEAGTLPEIDQGVAFANRGTAFLNKQNYVLAIDDYDHAEKFRPEDVNVLQGRCLARAVLKRDLDHALADCNRALELQPGDARILGYRALVYLRLELNETAITDYAAALEIEPKSAEYLYGRGQAKLRNGDVEGGNEDFAAARAINPKIAEDFAKLERDDSAWSWAALLEYWRSVMKAIY